MFFWLLLFKVFSAIFPLFAILVLYLLRLTFYDFSANFTTIYYPSLIFSSSSSSATSLDSSHNVAILIVEVVVMLPLMPVQFCLLARSSDRRAYFVSFPAATQRMTLLTFPFRSRKLLATSSQKGKRRFI